MNNHKKHIRVALMGNPNSGKTTIFNAITGARQRVGNWGGVTVEKKEGEYETDTHVFHLVDLPGTYSLTAYSIEEIVARNYIVNENLDVVVDVLDAGNLERNLYLAAMLVELGVKVVFALNMIDETRVKGLVIDIEKLGILFGAPMVETVGRTGEGIQELLEAVIRVAEDSDPLTRSINVYYGDEIEEEVEKLSKVIGEQEKNIGNYSERWLAVKLIEGDKEIEKQLPSLAGNQKVMNAARNSREHLENIFQDDIESVVADRRYGFAAGAYREVVKAKLLDRIDISERIDNILMHKYLAFPIFSFILWLMFQFTFKLGGYPMQWIETGFEWLGESTHGLVGDGLFARLIFDGIIAGVGNVMVFTPVIMLLFLCVSFLEDSGYMARAAFIMDRIMHSIGLHGKSFIPFIMGFGCTVPAIMATRTLESRRDRILTILILPLASCSARLPIYILLAAAFFPANAGNVIYSMYIIGLLLAVFMGLLFKRTLFKGETAPFIMELPPYRKPHWKSTVIHMWDRASIFIRRMGTVILAGSIIIWVLETFPLPKESVDVFEGHSEAVQTVPHTSYLSKIGHVVEPLVKPIGLDWRAAVALITGFVAKEIVVSTLAILYNTGDDVDSLRNSLKSSGMTPITAYAFMLFVLIYVPCLSSIAAIRRETNSWFWPGFSIFYSTTLAWIVSFTVYRVGMFLGIGA